MVDCSVCGKKIGWMDGVSCPQCLKKIHSSCKLTLDAPGFHRYTNFCSYDCVVIWSSRFSYSEFGYAFFADAVSRCSDVCFKSTAVPILKAQSAEAVTSICRDMPSHERSVMVKEIYFGDLARIAEKAGRYEDAAKIYESAGMIEEAGKVRELNRRVEVRTTTVTVDLNTLIQQLRLGGLVSIYKCPSCGGSIKIGGSTNISQLSKCEYCGSVLKADDLVKFIQEILR